VRSVAVLDVCSDGHCENLGGCEPEVCDDGPTEPRAEPSPQSPKADEAFAVDDTIGCPFAARDVPPFESIVDDSDIPEFNRARARSANYLTGNDYLQDWELMDHLRGVHGRLFECLDLAACYQTQPTSAGALEFKFELEPDGRVSAVSVAPSPGLDQPVVRACARRSVYQARFPSWNGSRMVVDYSFEVSLGEDV